MTPRVSVIIVTYRSRAALEACLSSLTLCRDRFELEPIVVDNAPEDGTAAWLAAMHPWVKVIANERNRGFTGGVNQGLALATGQALLLLNPDCELSPEALAGLLEALEGDPRAAAAAPMLTDGAGHPVRSAGRFPNLWTLACDHLALAGRFPNSPLFGGYKYGDRPLAALEVVDWASGAALLVPRAVYGEVGGLDEGIFMYMEEVDWCRRAADAGYHVRFVPGSRFVHHGQQSSRHARHETYLHNLRSRVYYFRKHHGPWAALAARAILTLSLALKWTATRLDAKRAGLAVTYAHGLRAVWAGSGR